MTKMYEDSSGKKFHYSQVDKNVLMDRPSPGPFVDINLSIGKEQVEATDEKTKDGAKKIDIFELLFHDRQEQFFKAQQIEGIDLFGDDAFDIERIDQAGDLHGQHVGGHGPVSTGRCLRAHRPAAGLRACRWAC